MACLSDNEVLAASSGEARDRDHLDACAPCRRLVSATVRAGHGAAPTVAAPAPRIGRFELEALLGIGAMGEVYRARDPRLDRAVALKIVRFDRDDAVARRGLLAEARAQARVSDPHVVEVYEADELEDGTGVLVAMALADGETLPTALARRPRSAVEIAALYAQAARGLVAVHRAGLVHRDVKPDNLVVGGDGRVRVADFGLAAPPGAGRSGTPRYMAPEQRDGRAVDGRADQVGLCTALDEALAGATTRPPRWLRRAIARGRADDPSARFADAVALADALDPPRRHRHAGLALAAVAVAAAAAAALVLAARPGSVATPADRCVAAARLDTLRSPARQRALANAVVRHRPDDPGVFARIDARIDASVERLGDAWRDACASATSGAGTSDGAAGAADPRLSCLGRQRSALAAAIDLVAAGDREVLARADAALSAVVTPEDCRAGGELDAADPPPADPERHRRWDALDEELAVIRATLAAGDPVDAAHRAERILEEARLIGHRPQLAAVLVALGAARIRARARADQIEPVLREALAVADAGRADRLRARAAIELVGVLGHDAARLAETRSFDAHAQAALARLGGDARVDAIRLDALGIALYVAGEPREARAHFERAISRLDAAEAPEPLLAAKFLDHLGMVLMDVGAPGEARAALERALAAHERAHGGRHPDVSVTLLNLALLVADAGDVEAALAMLERARALLVAALGPTSPAIADVHTNVAAIESGRGRTAEAIEHLRAALAIQERALGVEHVEVAKTQVRIATAFVNLDRLDEAAAIIGPATATLQASLGADHPDLATALVITGVIALERGRSAEAVASLERAVAMLDASGAAPAWMAEVRGFSARALWAAGRRDAARARYREARADAEAAGGHASAGWAEIEAWARARGLVPPHR